tara:strand:- start:124 stop:936 length:813 start_codon:yes stop_codon:yes gene_type:complete
MKYNAIFQISFGIILVELLFSFLDYFGIYSNYHIIELSWFLGIVLLSIGVIQLNKSLIVPSIVLIVSQVISSITYLLSTFDIFHLPINSALGWLFYSIFLYYLPLLILLILLKFLNKDKKSNTKLIISITLFGIALITRILMALIQEFYGDSGIFSNIFGIMRILQILTFPGALLLVNSCYIWNDSREFLSTTTQSSVVDINKRMMVGDWLITFLITVIPIVNIIMVIIWAFGSNGNIHRKEWAKAILIWFAIILALYLVIFVIAFGLIF